MLQELSLSVDNNSNFGASNLFTLHLKSSILFLITEQAFP
jgi:hypothetical protein